MKNVQLLLLAVALPLALVGCARTSDMTTEPVTSGGGVTEGVTPRSELPAVQRAPVEGGTAEANTLLRGTTSASNTIAQNVMALPILSNLAEAVQAAGLAETLSGPGPYTLFAPTNQAFDLVDKDDLSMMMSADKQEELKNLLLSHVTEGKTMYGQLNDGTNVVMLSGADITAARESTDRLMTRIGEADIVVYDIESSNGVIHVINLVLDPEGFFSQM